MPNRSADSLKAEGLADRSRRRIRDSVGIGLHRSGWRGLGRVRDTYSHAKSTAKVIENDPGAGVASVIHGGGGGGCGWVGEERVDAKKAPALRPARRVLGGLCGNGLQESDLESRRGWRRRGGRDGRR